MAATLTDYNKNTDCATFYVDDSTDLVYLPTTTTGGSGDLSTFDKVVAGSTAMGSDGAVYILKSDDSWVEI